ncbi:hypothetical protein BU16DRAFT_527761 [Lophium mytilinum]|uniref:Nuclear membrane fusion protein Kar5 n=1 Tax=Lophium mytilinum TaxID=390894 RepID=A0A6A6QV27_9PEZI|nr:hypothetical protein BU16DRAFT_527761 [Lophium mytilinum]
MDIEGQSANVNPQGKYLLTLSTGIPSDLASKLQHPPVQRQELLSQALRIIHSVESSSSCNRLAALNLINSCQSLETSPKGSNTAGMNSDLGLDEVKSEYAARLAVCELIGAGANIPGICAIFVPSAKACVKYRFTGFWARNDHQSETQDTLCYPQATPSQFVGCLKALEARPQYWTSYSNARQNAVVMCQASRDAIEKDEKIALYRSLADATTNIASALAESIREAQAQLDKQKAFIEQIRASEAQAFDEFRKGHENSLSALDSVSQTAQSVIDMVFRAFKGAGAEAVELHEAIHKSKESILDMHKEVAIAHSENTEVALVAKHALFEVYTALGGLQDGLRTSSELMADMSERQTLLDEHLNMTFENLMTAVEETTERIQRISIFGGFGVSNSRFGVILLIVGTWSWFASSKVAGVFAILYGVFLVLCSVVASPWFHYALDKAYYLAQHPAAIPVLVLLLAVGFICYLSSFVYRTTDDDGNVGYMIKPDPAVLPTSHPRPVRHYSILKTLRLYR